MCEENVTGFSASPLSRGKDVLSSSLELTLLWWSSITRASSRYLLCSTFGNRGTMCSFENLTISSCCLIFLHCLDWCFIILLFANYYEALPNTCKLAFLNHLSEVCIKLTPLFFEILPSSSHKIDLLLYTGGKKMVDIRNIKLPITWANTSIFPSFSVPLHVRWRKCKIGTGVCF